MISNRFSPVAIAKWSAGVLLWLACVSLLLGMQAAAATEVVSGDLSTILATRSGKLTVWRLADNPNILIFDFPSLSEQGRTFNRLTQLTEQFNEPYKRVMRNDEFVKYMNALRRDFADFAFGHDLLISEAVLFFNLVERDKIELYPEELALRSFLVDQGMLKTWRGIYQAAQGDVVLLSIPQIQEKRANEPQINEFARRAIALHEIAHGEYYTNRYYADYCRKFWSEILDDEQRNVFKRFLSNYNYSINAEELLVNEMQAYLMFTPDPASFSAAKLGIKQAQLDAMRDAFANGKPPTRLPIFSQGVGTRR